MKKSGWVRPGLLIVVMLAIFLYGYTQIYLPEIQTWYNNRLATCLDRQSELIKKACDKSEYNTADQRACAEGVQMQYSCPRWF